MRRSATAVWLLFLVSVPLWLQSPYYLHVLIISGIFTIAAMSLNLLLGYTGQLSLGHVAFFGIGAYTSALASLGFDLELTDTWTVVVGPNPVGLSFSAAIAVAALFGWLIGKLSFKVRGAYFVIVTVSFAEVVRLLALNWVDLTEGPMALNNIPPMSVWLPAIGDYRLLGKVPNYYLMLAMAVLSYVIIARLVRSRAGRAMVALRENEALATSVGVDVTRYLVLATIVSAALAGAAGALYTHYVRIVDPDIFLFIYTVTMVIMVITGGKGTLAGPIVGGIIFGIVPQILRAFAGPELQWIIYGVLMILIVYFLPEGIVPALRNEWQRRRGARGAGGGAAPSVPAVPEGDADAPGRPMREPLPAEGNAHGGKGAPATLAAHAPGVELAVNALSIRFGGLVAVEDMTFEVRTGEVLSLIGPNGAGKTSAFNAITGYLQASSGEIAYRGRRLNGLRPNAIAAMGVVRTFQKTSVFGGQSVLDNVLIGLHLRSRQRPLAIMLGLPSIRREERELQVAAWDILRFVGLDARAREQGAALPYGEQRLLEVAVALAANPKLLLLDEPVSGMNPVEKSDFMQTLDRIRARNVTVLLVEHDMRTVMGVSDRIVVLNQGRIIASGPPADIQRNPEVIRAYLGERYARAHR